VTSAETLTELFDRIQEIVHVVVDGLGAALLNARIASGTNSVTWLVWHLTRIQDDHIAAAAGTEQVWTSEGWADRFGLPFDASATGYGHSAEDVAAVSVQSGSLLTGYHHAVHRATIAYVAGLSDDELDRIVDESWDPPVTLGARLVSVIADDLQHAGQASYARGILGG